MRKERKQGPFISLLLERSRKNELNLFGAKEQQQQEEEGNKKKKDTFSSTKVCFPLN